MAVTDEYSLTASGTLHLPSKEQIRLVAADAQRTFNASKLTPHERGTILDRATACLQTDSERIVSALPVDCGLTLSDTAGELKRCLETFRLSAEEAQRFPDGGWVVALTTSTIR